MLTEEQPPVFQCGHQHISSVQRNVAIKRAKATWPKQYTAAHSPATRHTAPASCCLFMSMGARQSCVRACGALFKRPRHPPPPRCACRLPWAAVQTRARESPAGREKKGEENRGHTRKRRMPPPAQAHTQQKKRARNQEAKRKGETGTGDARNQSTAQLAIRIARTLKL